MKPKPPDWLDKVERNEWLRLWKQSFRLIPVMCPEDRARGVTSAFERSFDSAPSYHDDIR